MGKMDRLKRITLGRIEAFLDTLEKPETLLPRLVREMGGLVTEAANAKAKALLAVKASRRRMDEASGKVSRLENGVKLAVAADDIETARQAIAVQIQAEQQVQACQAELELAEKAYQSADAVCRQLAGNLTALKEKKKALLAKHRTQQLTKQLQQQYTQTRIEPGKDIWETVARMETRVEQQQIELEVQTELTKTLGVSFDQERVQKLEHHAQVDERLNKIKKQFGKEQ
ncbi:MAG: PspA/IM30 family protein [Planctomycetota bacterium]|jgi:phage shock protein A